jgi:hypothetical protein
MIAVTYSTACRVSRLASRAFVCDPWISTCTDPPLEPGSRDSIVLCRNARNLPTLGVLLESDRATPTLFGYRGKTPPHLLKSLLISGVVLRYNKTPLSRTPKGPSYPRWLSILVAFFAKEASHIKHFTFLGGASAYQPDGFSNLSGIVGTSICRWKILFEYGWRLVSPPNDKYNKGRCSRFSKESWHPALPNSHVTKQGIQNVASGPWELVLSIQKCYERQPIWLLVSLACSTIEVAIGGRH